MAFFSTRGESCVVASQAILRGLAPDGGLYVPAMFPAVSEEQMIAFGHMDYASRALEGHTGVPAPRAVKELKTLPVLHTRVCEKGRMGEAVLRGFA